jgi:hypothetical protein
MFGKVKPVLFVVLMLLMLVPTSASAAPMAASTKVCYTGSSTGWINQGGEIHHYVQFNNVRARLSNISVGVRLIPNPGQILVSPWGYYNSTTFRAGFRYPNGVTRPPAWAFWMCGYYNS